MAFFYSTRWFLINRNFASAASDDGTTLAIAKITAELSDRLSAFSFLSFFFSLLHDEKKPVKIDNARNDENSAAFPAFSD